MCSTPSFLRQPDIPTPPAPPEPPKPTEALKTVQADGNAARQQALRRLALKANLASTNPTGGSGLTGAAPVQFKSLLGS
jgi:hypothetical protein